MRGMCLISTQISFVEDFMEWSKVNSNGLSRAWVYWLLILWSSTYPTDLDWNIDNGCILFKPTRICWISLFVGIQSWPNKINFVTLFLCKGFSWRTILSAYTFANQYRKILLYKSVIFFNTVLMEWYYWWNVLSHHHVSSSFCLYSYRPRIRAFLS